jgi:hypothetical protein
MQVRRPQTPLFWVFHRLSANKFVYVPQCRVVSSLGAHVHDVDDVRALQIEDVHREIEP